MVGLHGQTAPENPRSLYELGSNQFSHRDFAEAKASFTRAIELDNLYADAYRGLGMTDLELKDYQGAYHAWLRAVELNPKDEKSSYLLGRLFYEADIPNEAAAWLRQALSLNPNDYQAMTYLGLSAEALGFESTARSLYQEAIAASKSDKNPYSWAFLSLGKLLKKEGDEKQALVVLEEGSRECPEARELTAFGELLASHNQAARAEDVLRRAIALDPSLSQAHYRLGLLLKSLGRTSEAQAEMAKFQETKAEEDKAPKIMALRK